MPASRRFAFTLGDDLGPLAVSGAESVNTMASLRWPDNRRLPSKIRSARGQLM